MTMLNLKIYSSAFLTFLFLQGCSSNNEDKQTTNEVVKTSGLEKIACAFRLDEGRNFDEVLPDKQLLPSYFQKTFDSAELHAVLNLSAQSTLQFIAKTTVDVFSISEKKSASCKMYESVPTASNQLRTHWNGITKSLVKNNENDDTTIMGLYLEKGKSDLSETAEKAKILVRQDSSRWTLVHEFLHHLFHEARTGPSDEQLLAELQTLGKDLDRLGKSERVQDLDSQKIKVVIDKVVRLVDVSKKLLLASMFEEATIETLLGDHFETSASDHIENVSLYDAANAAIYSNNSISKGQGIIKTFQKSLNEIQREYSLKLEKGDFASLETLRNDLNNIQRESDDIFEKNQGRANKLIKKIILQESENPTSFLMGDTEDADNARLNKECSHSEEIFRLIQGTVEKTLGKTLGKQDL